MQNKALPVRIEGPIKVDAEVKAIMVGDNGKSAYEIAVAHGYKGTESEWLESLKGLQGPQGKPGLKGDPFRYEDFTPEQLEALKGPKGPKGDKGEDGRDGTSATADNTYRTLLEGNVWCESASVDHVLTAILGNSGKPFPRVGFKELKVLNTFRGQRVIGVEGEPHYTVKLGETEFKLGQAGTGNITLEEGLGDDDVKITYHNFLGEKVGDFIIAGVPDDTAAQPDEIYTALGSKYSKYGRKLVINITNQETDNNWASGKNFKFFGKWTERDFDSIELVTNGKKLLRLYLRSEIPGLPSIPIFVNKPELVTFLHLLSPYGNTLINIGTKGDGLRQINFRLDTLEWDSASHQYINTGSDPL
ncbi:hypothetical protein [uncultured Veillonella sp.]|jgi:hypothetical protein|uniref:collagen-like triple helix repeat-containing protein n=1 Tax=uncultured Veillonella sp. TaxID=159268 RepID=UPI00262CE538|nr:hypothetical protein [uncultured Veillonella sp.]